MVVLSPEAMEWQDVASNLWFLAEERIACSGRSGPCDRKKGPDKSFSEIRP
jgi:hypothetical protein